jgi:hypothetical protein
MQFFGKFLGEVAKAKSTSINTLPEHFILK